MVISLSYSCELLFFLKKENGSERFFRNYITMVQKKRSANNTLFSECFFGPSFLSGSPGGVFFNRRTPLLLLLLKKEGLPLRRRTLLQEERFFWCSSNNTLFFLKKRTLLGVLLLEVRFQKRAPLLKEPKN